MRLLYAATVWIVIFGGLGLYMRLADGGVEQAAARIPEQARLDFALEITTTFDAAPDPFAPDFGTDAAGQAVTVRRGEEIIFAGAETAAGIPLRIEDVEPIAIGVNEFHVSAAPPPAEAGVRHAVLVRLLQNDRIIAEETFWAEPGQTPSGSFRPIVRKQAEGDES